jgi:DNA repair protein RadC
MEPSDVGIERVHEGPRERLRKMGIEALSDEELLALVLGTGSIGEPVTLLAARLLREAGGLVRMARWGSGALTGLGGIGEGKAARIVAAVELGRRIYEVPWVPGPRVDSSRDVEALVRPRLIGAEVEHFVALALDAKNRVRAELRLASGGMHGCAVAPGDVFRSLLREAASGVIFVHNHPSGDAQPSAEACALTARLIGAGALLGVRVLDHVIIGREGYFSFLDRGLMHAPEHAAPRPACHAQDGGGS